MSCGMSVVSDCANTIVLRVQQENDYENAMHKVAAAVAPPSGYLEETKRVDVVAYQ